MTEKRRRRLIAENMRGAADIAKQAENCTPAEKTVVFLFLVNMFNDRSIYKRDISEFDSYYVDENLSLLVSGMKSLDERVSEKKLYRICAALIAEFQSEVSGLCKHEQTKQIAAHKIIKRGEAANVGTQQTSNQRL